MLTSSCHVNLALTSGRIALIHSVMFPDTFQRTTTAGNVICPEPMGAHMNIWAIKKVIPVPALMVIRCFHVKLLSLLIKQMNRVCSLGCCSQHKVLIWFMLKIIQSDDIAHYAWHITGFQIIIALFVQAC